ncbi:MAG: tetratricopeptide repeat protein [Bacteroidota bacterium]
MTAFAFSSKLFFKRPVSYLTLVFLLMLGIGLSASARDANIDSLKQVIAPTVMEKNIHGLLDLAAQNANDNLDQALAYASIALDKAVESKNHRDIFSVHREVGFYYENNNMTDSSNVAYQRALAIADAANDNQLKLVIYTDLAIINRMLGNYSITKEYHVKSLELATQTNNLKSVEYAYHGLGYLHETVGEYDEAIEYYFKSIEVAETRGSISGVITTSQNMGNTYLKLGDEKMALETIEKAYTLATEQNDTFHIANVLHDYGQILRESGRLDEALDKLQASLSVYEKVNVKPTIARSLINIADIYTKKGEFDKAQEYFMKSLEYKKFIRAQDFSELYNKFGNLNLKMEKLLEAEQAFIKSLAISDEHDFKDLSEANNRSLYRIYERKGSAEKALAHLKKYTELKDYLFNQDKAKHIAEMQFRFDMEQNEKEIQLLRLKQNKTMLIASSLLFLFVVVFLIYVINMRGRNNAELQQKHDEITTQNIKLRESNEVLNQFAYVAAHDLKEPLRNIGSFVNLIQIKYGHQFNEEALEYMNFVTGGVKRLNNLLIDLLEYSRISSQAPTGEEINISEIVTEVISNLNNSIQRKEAVIEYSKDLPSLRMNRLHLIQLFQNMISNALKFVDKTPKIIIDGKVVDDEVIMSVKDNGIGIDQDFGNKIFNLFHQLNKNKKYEGTGIGLTICKNIIDKYDGRIWFESEPDQGTTFYMSIPLKRRGENPTANNNYANNPQEIMSVN